MGYIHCCSSLHKSKTFELHPDKGYLVCELNFLEKCPVCGHTIIQVTRIDHENNVTTYRKINSKAIRFFEKIKPSIICEIKSVGSIPKSGGRFYLNYNEYGTKKKCYSNLSTLKMGLFENGKCYLNFKMN